MTIVVWTPTCRPGIDVTCEAVARQQVDDEIFWIVGDDLNRTPDDYLWLGPDQHIPAPRIPDLMFTPRALTARKYALDAAHNEALRIAREMDADLFVFLCDYTWISFDGIQRFADLARAHPRALMTGIAHTSVHPTADKVRFPTAKYTIFDEPFSTRPWGMGWEDVRLDRATSGRRQEIVEPCRWEGNWAALSREVLHSGVEFDEQFDDFHGCDNIDFALRCKLAGFEVWIDYDNVSIRLPRRTYWDASEQRLDDGRAGGMNFMWGRVTDYERHMAMTA